MTSCEEIGIKKQNASYKYCFVPHCQSTTYRNPEKVFVNVPKGEIRKKWIAVTRRDAKETSLQSSFYCCGDHFNLMEDLENYMRVCIDPQAPVILKKGVLPRFFACQPDRQKTQNHTFRKYPEKLKRARIMEEIEKSSKKYCTEEEDRAEEQGSHAGGVNDVDNEAAGEEESLPKMKDVGIQFRVRYRSIGIQVNIESPKPAMTTIACSPVKIFNHSHSFSSISSEDIGQNVHCSSDEFVPSEKSALSSDEELENKRQVQALTREMRVTRIKSMLKDYIGVENKALYVLDLLCEASKLKFEEVCLTLEKIKHDYSFAILGSEYGMSCTSAWNVFHKTIPILSHFLVHLIMWPSPDTIKESLPIAFRARYSNVQSIIDCFEVQIQKPTDPISQSLTWSEYKKGNTVKFLVSSTPDGTVNYVSEGFGGRTSDALIVENSDFLVRLPANCAVMADRGFKHIAQTLQMQKNCHLVRPPSVLSSEKPTKEEVLETKRIASVRIHIERVIKRFREYALLAPHATLPLTFLGIIDDIVVIVGALINLQSPVIAQP